MYKLLLKLYLMTEIDSIRKSIEIKIKRTKQKKTVAAAVNNKAHKRI